MSHKGNFREDGFTFLVFGWVYIVRHGEGSQAVGSARFMEAGVQSGRTCCNNRQEAQRASVAPDVGCSNAYL